MANRHRDICVGWGTCLWAYQHHPWAFQIMTSLGTMVPPGPSPLDPLVKGYPIICQISSIVWQSSYVGHAYLRLFANLLSSGVTMVWSCHGYPWGRWLDTEHHPLRSCPLECFGTMLIAPQIPNWFPNTRQIALPNSSQIIIIPKYQSNTSQIPTKYFPNT